MKNLPKIITINFIEINYVLFFKMSFRNFMFLGKLIYPFDHSQLITIGIIYCLKLFLLLSKDEIASNKLSKLH